MWKLTQGYLWYTRKQQKTSPWCNSRLRFMEYFLNSLEVSLYFSKEKQWLIACPQALDMQNVMNFALCLLVWHYVGHLTEWMVTQPELCPSSRTIAFYQLTNQIKWWCIMTKVFSSPLCYGSLSLSLSLPISNRCLQEALSSLLFATYLLNPNLDSKFNMLWRDQHEEEAGIWWDWEPCNLKNPQVWCSFAKCKDKMDLCNNGLKAAGNRK